MEIKNIDERNNIKLNDIKLNDGYEYLPNGERVPYSISNTISNKKYARKLDRIASRGLWFKNKYLSSAGLMYIFYDWLMGFYIRFIIHDPEGEERFWIAFGKF